VIASYKLIGTHTTHHYHYHTITLKNAFRSKFLKGDTFHILVEFLLPSAVAIAQAATISSADCSLVVIHHTIFLNMSSGERPVRIQTLPGQKIALRNFFTKENAQDWICKLRNMYFRTLIAEREFDNLGTSHISYQWRKFSAEYIVRKQVGAKYWRASLTIATDDAVFALIFDIISDWLEMLEVSPYPEFNIPTELHGFMKRCRMVSEAISAGAATIDEKTLTENDRTIVSQLIQLVVSVFVRYGAMWEKFQHMESGACDHGGGGELTAGKPHLVIADLELKLLEKRHAWVADPAVDSPQAAFMENTAIGEMLRKLTDAELFTASRPVDAPFIKIAIYARPGNRIELQKTLFTAFEEAMYKVYERRLILVELMQVPVTVVLNEEEAAIARSYNDDHEESLEFSETELCDMRGASNRVDASDRAGKRSSDMCISSSCPLLLLM